MKDITFLEDHLKPLNYPATYMDDAKVSTSSVSKLRMRLAGSSSSLLS